MRGCDCYAEMQCLENHVSHTANEEHPILSSRGDKACDFLFRYIASHPCEEGLRILFPAAKDYPFYSENFHLQ